MFSATLPEHWHHFEHTVGMNSVDVSKSEKRRLIRFLIHSALSLICSERPATLHLFEFRRQTMSDCEVLATFDFCARQQARQQRSPAVRTAVLSLSD